MDGLAPITDIGGCAAGWVLAVVFLVLYMRGEFVSRKTHDTSMALVQKRAELAEERAAHAESQRDELLLPLAHLADRTFRAIPTGPIDVPPAREGQGPREAGGRS